jgi:hypothetical protein
MKKTIGIFIIILILTACSTDKPSGLILNGTIENLKVGTVYLQKIKDGTIINMDSVVLDGTGSFTLKHAIKEPQILYVYLNKKDASSYNDRIAFFASDTTMTLHTDLYDFEDAAVVTGGTNQRLYSTYLKNTQKLNQVYTDLIKRELTLQAADNPSIEEFDKLTFDYRSYLRKKVLYNMNYANSYRDTELAVYLLLQETEGANPKIIDSIYKMMPKKIQASLYGKELSEFLSKTKK